MAKKFKAIVRLQLEAGKANPAPPEGPALAGHGINIMAFCKEYNARTSNRQGDGFHLLIGGCSNRLDTSQFFVEFDNAADQCTYGVNASEQGLIPEAEPDELTKDRIGSTGNLVVLAVRHRKALKCLTIFIQGRGTFGCYLRGSTGI